MPSPTKNLYFNYFIFHFIFEENFLLTLGKKIWKISEKGFSSNSKVKICWIGFLLSADLNVQNDEQGTYLIVQYKKLSYGSDEESIICQLDLVAWFKYLVG